MERWAMGGTNLAGLVLRHFVLGVLLAPLAKGAPGLGNVHLRSMDEISDHTLRSFDDDRIFADCCR